MDNHCHYCKKPIGMNEGYYVFDLNIGACAAGAGNLAKAHSACGDPLGLKQHWVARNEAERKAAQYRATLAEIEEILFDDLKGRATERARKKVMDIVAKALYG